MITLAYIYIYDQEGLLKYKCRWYAKSFKSDALFFHAASLLEFRAFFSALFRLSAPLSFFAAIDIGATGGVVISLITGGVSP